MRGRERLTSRGRDERGAFELVGAILLFALIVMMLVLAQVILVPTLNEKAEFEHSREARADALDVRSGVSQVAATGTPVTVDYELGFDHPERALLLNPPPVVGTFETVEGLDFGVENAVAAGETGDYWTGDPKSYDSRAVRITASYREFRGGAPTHLEHSLVYGEYEGGPVPYGDATGVVEGRRITLVSLAGEFGESSDGTASIGLRPLSAPAETTAITNADGTNVRIVVATRLPEETWRAVLADEFVSAGGHVVDGSLVYTEGTPFSTLAFELEPGVTYDLRMARVGVGNGGDAEPAAYLTRDAGAGTVVPTGGGEVAVRAKDRFNNPVSGVPVAFAVVGDGTLSTTAATTDERGYAATVLSGEDATVTMRAVVDVDGDPGTELPHEVVEFVVQIGTGDADGTGDEINPNTDEGNLVYRHALVGTPNGDRNFFDVTFENTAPEAVSVERVRLNSFGPNGQGRSGTTELPAAVTFEHPAGTVLADLDVGGKYVTLSSPLGVTGKTTPTTDTNVTVRLSFFDGAGSAYKVYAGDSVLLTFEFADGTTATYSIVARAP